MTRLSVASPAIAIDRPSARVLPYPWILAGAFVIGAAIALWVQHLVVPLGQPFWGMFDNQLDLGVYRDGARVVLDGQSLYHAKLLGVMDYTYTPISVVMFMPFTLMPFVAAQVVWVTLTFVALYLTVMLSFRALGYRATMPLRVIAACLVVILTLLEPVRSTIWFGQINAFLMLVIVWDLTRPRGSRWRGFSVGLTGGIKLTPLLFIPYLVFTRDFKAVRNSLLTFVATIAVGFAIMPGESWTYWTHSLMDSNRVGAPNTLGNQSLRGAIANLENTAHPSTALWMALAVVALVAAFFAATWASQVGRELLAVTIIGLASAVVSPMSWGHHWVWVVPLTVIGIDRVVRSRTLVMRIAAVVAIVAVFLAMFAWPTYLPYPILYVQWWVPDAYLTGTFFLSSPSWLRWFVYDPYNWVFVFTVVATVATLWWTRSKQNSTNSIS
ncbi:glycosyltransferase 87 family protein [Gordonia jinhuaensis]|uniref:Alpha-1,2-mannosyltransferase n=1 Tax=Gordonia jinhuaensis TaxID=1517702 RepID=A0A916T4J7_9ACTN|nr:glycosyltransferase 87 family protein [Gordonia jinhuaensis]GGB28673.1 hypothetical protein GCM10011489_16120 [Gordonia jinhuaensis]